MGGGRVYRGREQACGDPHRPELEHASAALPPPRGKAHNEAMINDLRLLTAVALLLSACAAPMALVLPQSGAPVLHATPIALRARSAEGGYLGEVHDNGHHPPPQRRGVG